MQIKLGKSYRTVDGEKATITAHYYGNKEYRFEGKIEHADGTVQRGCLWNDKGKRYIGFDSCTDLVSIWEEPTDIESLQAEVRPFKKGDKVKLEGEEEIRVVIWEDSTGGVTVKVGHMPRCFNKHTGKHYLGQLPNIVHAFPEPSLQSLQAEVKALRAEIEALKPKPTVHSDWAALYSKGDKVSPLYTADRDVAGFEAGGTGHILRRDIVTYPDGKVEVTFAIEEV